MIALIGTPAGSFAAGSIAGLLFMGAQKRLFGCAAFSPESFFQGRPRQSIRESVTSIVRADRDYGVVLREVNDQSALRIDIQDTVQTAIEIPAVAQVLVGNAPTRVITPMLRTT